MWIIVISDGRHHTYVGPFQTAKAAAGYAHPKYSLEKWTVCPLVDPAPKITIAKEI